MTVDRLDFNQERNRQFRMAMLAGLPASEIARSTDPMASRIAHDRWDRLTLEGRPEEARAFWLAHQSLEHARLGNAEMCAALQKTLGILTLAQSIESAHKR